LLLFVTAMAIGLWEALLWLCGRVGRVWLTAGGRGDRLGRWGRVSGRIAGAAALAPLALGWLAVAGLAIWSVAGAWRFPAALPSSWAGAAWQRAAVDLTGTLAVTLLLAAGVALAAAILAVGCLEAEDRRARRPGQGHLWVLYTPLLVPQISFLFGATAGLVALGWDGAVLSVAWLHLTFVLPYVWLVLAGTWRALDPRWGRAAASLGRSPDGTLWRVKLPLVSPALALAIGLGMVISISLYLPTQFAGAGRIATLATETVGIALGADRRTGAVYALVLGVPAVACLGLAVAVPVLFWRHRRGMRAA
jgi:putative thiamine transport system permease protein